MEDLTLILNDKFLSFTPNRWMIHTWDYAGYDYGFDLLYIPIRDLWVLRTSEDSGYGSGKVILETGDPQIVWKLAECFEPTNPNYKTHRK